MQSLGLRTAGDLLCSSLLIQFFLGLYFVLFLGILYKQFQERGLFWGVFFGDERAVGVFVLMLHMLFCVFPRNLCSYIDAQRISQHFLNLL